MNINSFNVNECRTGDWENTVDPDTNFFNGIKFNCEYYTDAKFRAEMKCINGLKIIHFNARSLKSNFKQIKMYLTTLDVSFHIIAISETWFTGDTDPSELYMSPLAGDIYIVFPSVYVRPSVCL